jgi:predicted lipoprotein with Yx(FWY)xxD motif
MKIPALTAILAGAAVALTACGGAASGTTAASGGSSSQPSTQAQGLHVATTSLGKVLVDANGMTVYLLTADGRNLSTCAAQCLSFWPAVTSGHGKLGVPVGTTRTPDGTTTATVAGQPVYTFSQDNAAGDVNGEGVKEFGGTWYAVSPTGQAVTGSGSTGGSSGTTSGGPGRYSGGY